MRFRIEPIYMHFTSLRDAHAIAASLELWPDRYHGGHWSWRPDVAKGCGSAECYGCEQCNGLRAVYAQVEGGVCLPEVQRPGSGFSPGCGYGYGRVRGRRDWAVLFVPVRPPEQVSEYGTEVTWYEPEGGTLRLVEAVVVPAEVAVGMLV